MTASLLYPLESALASAAAAPVLLLVIKATGLLCIAVAAALVLQRGSAGARHLVWLVAIAGLLILPVLAVWSPLRVPVLPAPSAGAALVPSPAGHRAATHQVGPVTPVTSPVPRVSAAAPGTTPTATTSALPGNALPDLSPAMILLLIWGTVVALILARLATGGLAVRGIIRRAEPLDDPEWQTPLYEISDRMGLDRAPRLYRSDRARMPFAAGLVAPVIVLPADSDSWTPARRTAVLLHELSHIRRRDLVGHTLGRVVCALYWFHPLVWTAARRLRAESERACDDLALAFGTRASEYAEHLLDIVTCVRDHRTPAVALAMAHRKEFEGRMLAILDPGLRRRGPGRLQTAGITFGLGTVALLLGAAAPVARSAAMPQQPVNVAAGSDTGHTAAPHQAPEESVRLVPPSHPKQPDARSAVDGRVAVLLDPKVAGQSTQQPGERIAVLAHALQSDPSPEVRRVAAWGLEQFTDSSTAVAALVSAVKSDSSASVREMAAWALADAPSGSPATAALAQAVQHDSDPQVRRTALWALGSIGDAAALDAMTPGLASSDPDVRDMAAWAIGSAGPDKAPAALVHALGDSSTDVRESVVWALYSIGDPATAAPLAEAFHRESDPDVRHGMIQALGALGDGAVNVLEQLVTSPDTAVRRMAVTALAGGQIGGPWPWPRPEPRPFPDGKYESGRMKVRTNTHSWTSSHTSTTTTTKASGDSN